MRQYQSHTSNRLEAYYATTGSLFKLSTLRSPDIFSKSIKVSQNPDSLIDGSNVSSANDFVDIAFDYIEVQALGCLVRVWQRDDWVPQDLVIHCTSDHDLVQDTMQSLVAIAAAFDTKILRELWESPSALDA